MVRPVSFKGFQKGFQGVSLRGFRGFQIFLWELCVCIKYLSLGDVVYGADDVLWEDDPFFLESAFAKIYQGEKVILKVV